MWTYHNEERKRRKSHFSDYIHHRYHQPKCITLTSSFFMHLFIATTIVASQPDQSVAMNILNDRNGIHEEAQVLASIEMHKIILNEKLLPHKSNAKGRSIAMPFNFQSDLLLAKDSDQSKSIRNTPNGPQCNCSIGKSANVMASSCMQICNHHQYHWSQQQHEHQPKHYSKKLKRKRKQNIQNRMERREHLTLIYGIDAISNNTERSIVPIQSGEITATKFRRRPTHRHTNAPDEKSLNSNNARETNRRSRLQATYNSMPAMAFHSDEHFVDLQSIDANNNRIKKQMQSIAVEKTVDSNYGKSVKRIMRSIAGEMLSTQSDEKNMTKWHDAVVQNKLPLSATISTTIKSTVNGNFDSSTRRGGADEIIGSDAVGANRSSASTVSNETRAFDDVDANDYVNYSLDDNGALMNLASNLLHSEQHIDLHKSDDEWLQQTSTARSISDKLMNANTTCDTEPCYHENVTCIGEPEYCNLTELEYLQMLYDYIFPTPGEMVLIGIHIVVFLVGLIGNILVCIAVYANATMRTVTNIFIVNLAIADLLVIILCLPPTVIWDVTETWFLGEAMCKIILYLQTVSVTVSVLTLTFISIDRWYAICFPLRYVSTNGRAWCSIGVIWIGALLSDIPEFINSTTKKKELRFGIDLFTQCVSTWDKETEKNFYIARFCVLYLLPLFLMSIAYFKIICVLWKSDTIPGHRESCNQMHAIHARNTVGNSSTMSQLRARRKAAKMLVVVVVMFAICYLPVHTLNILRYTIDIAQNEVVAILSLISHWLCYANSAINPLIYNFMSGKFRREFVSVLERCRCSNRDIHRHHSCYFNTAGARLNAISPNTRSLCHFVSHRDRNKSFREKNVASTMVKGLASVRMGHPYQEPFQMAANYTHQWTSSYI